MIRLSLGNIGCIAGDTKILCDIGLKTIFSIKDLYRLFGNEPVFNVRSFDGKGMIWNRPAFNVRSFDGKGMIWNRPEKILYSGKKSVCKLYLMDGKSLTATPDHKIMTSIGWVQLERLRKYDKVMLFNGIFKEVDVIEYLNDEIDTYDIVCADPYHNFVANGIVVHNSGKTLSEVRNLYHNPTNRITHSNITTTKLKNNIPLKPEMIIKKVHDKDVKHRDGSIEPVYKYELNHEYWRDVKKPLNIVFDEAHTLMNSRRPHSKINLIMGDFLALLRRILGSNEAGEGEAVFITQLPRRLDVITREMACEVRHHIGHYQKRCNKCKFTWDETSDQPERLWLCPRCGTGDIKKVNHIIEVLKFKNMNDYYMYIEMGRRTYFNRYLITDGAKYFKYYNTLQWDSLFSDFY